MRLVSRAAWALIILTAFAAPLLSQGHPWPSATPQICTVCSGTSAGKPMYPFSLPIKGFAGRFLDSARTADWQIHPRTLRAKRIEIVPEHDRVYIQMGSLLASYPLSTFFTSRLGQQLSSVSAYRQGAPGEQYLEYESSLYPEAPGSGWQTVFADGQDRLYDFDWDDRGYVYVAYSTFGFGIVNGKTLSLINQQLRPEVVPTRVVSVRNGSSYYLLVSNHQDSKTLVYNVTNATSPVRVGTLPFGMYAASSVGGSRFAIIRNDLSLGVYDAAALVANGSARLSLSGPYSGVTTDGVNFFALFGSSGASDIAISAISGDNRESRLVSQNDPFITMLGVRYSSGYLTVWGKDAQQRPNIRILRIQGAGSLKKAIDLGDYIPFYYRDSPPGYAHSIIGYTNDPTQAFIYQSGAKEYLFYLTPGFGDVYEVDSRDLLDISLKPGSFGTVNPNAPAQGTTPYYGDLITFASVSGSPKSLSWDFGNPEGGATNTMIGPSGTDAPHRYAGIALTADSQNVTRTVTASDQSDSTNRDTLSVQMKVPVARVRLKNPGGTSALITSLTSDNSLPIFAGDTFADASDGTVEGHYSSWTRDSLTVIALPTVEQGVGGCGAHTLNFQPNYVPYSGTSTISPGPYAPFTPSVRHAYEARALASSIALVDSPASSDSLSFRITTRFASAQLLPSGGSTAAKVTWELITPSGSVQKETFDSTLGAQPLINILKSRIVTGSKVVVTMVLSNPLELTAPECRTTYASSRAEYLLNPPDPKIVKVSGCEFANSPCTLAAGSASNRERTGWTYLWEYGSQTGAGETFAPSFSTAGSHTIKLKATNTVGSANATLSVTVAPKPCSGRPTSIGINYEGKNGCSRCTAAEPIMFSPLGVGYVFQDCDTYEWNFGDGTPNSTQRAPEHKFAADGTYNVRLTVTNDFGSAIAELSIALGTNVPQCQTPGAIFPRYQGPVSGCAAGKQCYTSEEVAFSADLSGYVIQAGCDRFLWNFGDGTTSTSLTTTHAYKSAGFFTVSLEIKNSAGSVTRTTSVSVGAPPCLNVPGSDVVIHWSGPSSQCSTTTSSRCFPNEELTLEARATAYAFQACDTFQWTFGDGTSASGKTVKHKFSNAGTYNVTLVVTNVKGRVEKKQTFDIGFAAEPPTLVTFTRSSGPAFVGKPITFTGSGTPIDKINSWKWSFGDGTEGEGRVVEHTFMAPGRFRVSLTAAIDGSEAPPYSDEIVVEDAQPFSFLLPVVAHLPGQNNSEWRTDLHIFSPGASADSPLTLTLEFQSNRLAKTITKVITTSTYIREDLLLEFTTTSDAGSVLVKGAAKTLPQMWTRIYTVSSTGIGTFGQLVPAVPIAENGSIPEIVPAYIIPGLQSSARYRSNVGLVNGSNGAVSVKVEVFDDSPQPRKLGEFTVSLNPFQFQQINDLTVRVPAITNGRPYSLRVRNTIGYGLFAYGSMVDNTSNDPVLVPAISEEAMKGESQKSQVLPGVGRAGSWRSDFTIFNPDTKSILFDLAYHEKGGALKAQIRNVPLAPNGMIAIQDVLGYPQWSTAIPDSTGIIRVTTTSTGVVKYPIVFGRTYSDQKEKGTFGQGISGFAASIANVKLNEPAFIAAVRSDSAYYTNLGLVSLGSGPTYVRVALLDEISGAENGAIEYSLELNQSIIDSGTGAGIVRKLHPSVTSGTLRIDVLAGGPVWAFASIIDKATKDPEYVPALPSETP